MSKKVLKTGYLWKQGGSYKSWRIRYFMLRGNSLEYYKSEGDGSPKGTIDLTTGRGVRTREQCDLEWPDKARPGLAFGLAVENRTFYMYGEDPVAVEDWMTTIQKGINKVGKPTANYGSDATNTSETKMSKVMRSGAKMMAKVTKKLSKTPAGEEAGYTSVSEEGLDSCVEEVYDDVVVRPVKTEGKASSNDTTSTPETKMSKVTKKLSKTHGESGEYTSGSEEGLDSSVEEVYDDVIIRPVNKEGGSDATNTPETRSKVMRNGVKMMAEVTKKLTEAPGDEAGGGYSSGSEEGLDSCVEEVYDDVVIRPVKKEGRASSEAVSHRAETGDETCGRHQQTMSSYEIEQVYGNVPVM